MECCRGKQPYLQVLTCLPTYLFTYLPTYLFTYQAVPSRPHVLLLLLLLSRACLSDNAQSLPPHRWPFNTH